MPAATRTLAEGLGAAVRPTAVSAHDLVCRRAAIDGQAPRCVVEARSLDDVARTLAFAYREALAVVPRGNGSALELGHPVERVDIVLDLRRLNALVAYQPDDLTVTVQAGLPAGVLAARLAAHRQILPVDAPGAARRTLGGIAATNASGPLRLRYGTLRDLLLGVRFVQPDGVVTWGGARVVKSVSGYDVPKLMVGALGTLGVIAELTLRLHPMPDAEATSLVTFERPEAAADFVARLLDSTVQPNRMEFLNEAALVACGVPRARAAIALSIASVEDAVREQTEVASALAVAAGGPDHPAPARLWESYDRAMLGAGRVVLRVATLVSRLAETVAEVERAVGTVPGARATIGGSAALGLLRVGLAGLDDPGACAGVIERVRRNLAPGGGTVVVESGPRELRASVDPWGPVAPEAFALMRKLRDAIDPTRVLNPGRFVGGL
jgi:glycolate oxidase FAD binding subunit